MFVLKDFLRHISPKMLTKYCEANNINFKASDKEEPQEVAENFIKHLNSLDRNSQGKTELNFQEIKDIVGEKGSKMLIDEIKESDPTFNEEKIDELNNYDKAMWFFLTKPDIFSQVSVNYEIEKTVGWLPYNIQTIPKKDVLNKEKKLAEAVRNYYYETELRGKVCEAEYFEKNDLICYVAYPQDYIDREITYDQSNKLNKRDFRQPVFKVFFLYSPEESRLSVKVKGGNKKKDELIKLFAKTVLNQELSEKNKVTYNLNILKNFNKQFPYPPEDQVEQVKVTELRMQYPKAFGRKIVITVNKEGSGLTDIGNFIEKLSLPLNEIDITQAKIYVKFKPEIKRSKGTVTALITAPSSCNLGASKLERKVRQYLKDWEIDTSQ